MGKRNKSIGYISSDVARSLIFAMCIALIGLNFYKALRNADGSATALEKAHIEWVLSHGAIVNVEIGKACTTCPRGLIAIKDVKPAGLILRIPETALIKFPRIEHSAFAAVSRNN